MRRVLLSLGALFGVLAAGCSEPTVTSTPDEPATAREDESGDTADEPADTGEADSDEPATELEPEPQGPAAVGDMIELDASEGALEVTVLEVYDPASPDDEFTTAEGRFVAIELALTNGGEGVYEDSVGNMVQVIDVDDQQYSTTFAEVAECAGFGGGSVRLPAGDARRGCVVFDLPADTQLQAVAVTTDSGFGPETGRFDLSGYEPGSGTADAASASLAPADATVGDSITLTSSETDLGVTVADVIDPADPADEFTTPQGRFVAVQIELANAGDGVYEDSPGNMLLGLDSQAQQYSTTFAEVAGCQAFEGGSVRLGAGDTRRGCVTFDLPDDVTLEQLAVTPNSGFGPQTGRWSVGS